VVNIAFVGKCGANVRSVERGGVPRKVLDSEAATLQGRNHHLLSVVGFVVKARRVSDRTKQLSIERTRREN
jgi:hypothetical protein